MKRLLYIATAIVAGLILNGCGLIDEQTFDETLLAGYWVTASQVNGTPNAEYWYYSSDGTGYTWDTSDDITESEAQGFTWELTGSTMKQIHNIEMGGNLPKYYTMKTLTETTMVYYDEKGEKNYTFTKTIQP